MCTRIFSSGQIQRKSESGVQQCVELPNLAIPRRLNYHSILKYQYFIYKLGDVS